MNRATVEVSATLDVEASPVRRSPNEGTTETTMADQAGTEQLIAAWRSSPAR
jgi:hypothetical protein